MSLQERWAWLPRGAAFVRSNDKEDQHYRGQTIKAQSEWYLFVVMVDKIRGLSGSLFILLVGFKKSGIGEGGEKERWTNSATEGGRFFVPFAKTEISIELQFICLNWPTWSH